MTNPVHKAIQASRKVHKTLAGVSVTLQRGASVTTGITATLGFTGEDEFNGEGTFVQHTRFRDYLIDVADYKIDGVAVTPVIGDIIYESIDGVTRKFRVMESQADPVTNYDERYRTWWRLHGKEVPNA